MKKENRKGKNLPPIRVRAINTNSGESFDYDSIKKCSKEINVENSSIRKILEGIYKTSTSKKDKNKYTFERL